MLRPMIIGIGGGIASRLANDLSKRGIPFDATSSRPRPDTWQLDLNRPGDFDYNLVQSNHLVLLAAAISSPDQCQKQYDLAQQINVTGSLEFAQRCLERGAKILFFSSDTVYGPSTPGCIAFTEEVPLNPLGEYAAMKAAVETQLLTLGEVKVVRLSYVFFKTDKFTTYLSKCALDNQSASVFDPFDRCIVYVEDLIALIELYRTAWSQIHDTVINVGGGSPISRWEFALMIKDLVYPQLRLTKIEPEADFFRARPRLIVMNTDRLVKVLGRPATAIKDAISQEFTEK